MNSPLRIAQVRIAPEQADLPGNAARLMRALDELSRERVDVVVTPECFLDGYIAVEDSVTRDTLANYAIDPSSNPYVGAIRDWAREHSTWVILGVSRRAPEGIYNSALIIDRSGKLVGCYDKTHCQTHDQKYLAGQSLPVFDSDFGLFGVLICADRRWPEAARSLAVQGARVIFNPTFGMCDDRNRRMMQTRSFESEVFIAFTHPVQSLLTDPTGGILCNDTHDDAEYSVTEIDLSRVDTIRPGPAAHLRDRRTDLYLD